MKLRDQKKNDPNYKKSDEEMKEEEGKNKYVSPLMAKFQQNFKEKYTP